MYQFQILERLLLKHLLFIDKGYNDFFPPAITFNFYLPKPVDIELKVIVVVIQAHIRALKKPILNRMDVLCTVKYLSHSHIVNFQYSIFINKVP